jgi:catechol 2,3-dioxygenase-like lactoylglutathione lyase family enzyme
MLARFSRVVLTVRGSEGLASAVQFYHDVLGLQVLRLTDDWAELHTQSSIKLCLQAVANSEAHVSTGYSPMITFDIDNLPEVVSRCIQAGAHLDGPIQFPAHGTVAAIRAPDGHMIGLYEPKE